MFTQPDLGPAMPVKERRKGLKTWDWLVKSLTVFVWLLGEEGGIEYKRLTHAQVSVSATPDKELDRHIMRQDTRWYIVSKPTGHPSSTLLGNGSIAMLQCSGSPHGDAIPPLLSIRRSCLLLSYKTKSIPLAGNPFLEKNSLSLLTGSLSLLVIIHHTTRLLLWIALDLDREGATAW